MTDWRKTDIAIGQLWRKSSHVKHFNKACLNPGDAQRHKLMQIIKSNVNTSFGKSHKFDRISSVEDYQKYVPPATYENLKPYIDNVMAGQKKQLTEDEPFMFATTSGTTDIPKFIPINNKHLADYTHAFQVHNYHLVKDFWQATAGQFFIISSNDKEGQVSSGLPYGAVSGLLNKRQSPLIRRHFAVPYEVCKIKNVEMKYYLMLRTSLMQNVTSFLACNPSSLILLADQLKEHSIDLIADIFDGKIKNAYLPSAEWRNAFLPYLKPDKTRARQLEKIMETESILLPKNVWTQSTVISCWKGGPMSFYLEKLPEYYGDIPVRDFGYMASEGRGSIPISDEGAGGALAVTSHFFEFVAEEDMDSSSPKFLTAENLEVNGRYYIFFTTNAGLYRYNINDLIEVVGFYENTPIIEFVRKGLGISSITGEKITEEQVLTAFRQVTNRLSLDNINHFTAEVKLALPPYYVCFVETDISLSHSVQEEFVRLFDQSLRLQNPEYEEKRASNRLAMPKFKMLPIGTYKNLRQQRVTEGAPEAQVKIPLLSTSSSFASRLELLAKKEVIAS
jgi:hypothetical protein